MRRLSSTLLALLSLPAAAANVTVPVHDSGGAVSRFLALDLVTGRAYEIEPRRGGEAARTRPLNQNVYTDIGRPSDPPAIPGEFVLSEIAETGGRTRGVLLLETTTGYAAMVSRVGEDNRLGVMRTLTGRPVEALASGDGRYLFLTRRESVRRGQSGFLVHGTDGGCLYFEGLERTEDDPTVRRCESVAAFEPASNAAPLETSSGTINGYFVVDARDGSLLHIGFSAERNDRLVVTRSTTSLATVFPDAPAAPSPRFALASIRSSDDGTVAVLVVDAATGRMAVVTNLDRLTAPRVTLAAADLAQVLPRTALGKPLEALPRDSALDATLGVLIISAGRDLVWITAATAADTLRAQPVEERN